MKKIISVLAIAGIAITTSCNTSAIREKEAALQAQQNTIDSMRLEMVRQQVVDSMNEMTSMQFVVPQMIAPAMQEVATTKTKPAAKKSTRTVAKKRTTTRNTASYPTQTVAQNDPAPVYQTSNPAPVYQEPQKKGWSAKAKGAVIGAGAGAAAGAIINKRNRVAGAVIGGVLGAGAGTGIGAIIDKKNGR